MGSQISILPLVKAHCNWVVAFPKILEDEIHQEKLARLLQHGSTVDNTSQIKKSLEQCITIISSIFKNSFNESTWATTVSTTLFQLIPQ